MHSDMGGETLCSVPPPSTWYRRSRRVTLLLAGIVLLSVADLLITLTHVTSTGMMEANPIAVLVIRATDSPWALASFKLCTVLISVAMLYRLRRHRTCEFAAWFGLLVLVGLAMMWHCYSTDLPHLEEIRLAAMEAGDESWIVLD